MGIQAPSELSEEGFWPWTEDGLAGHKGVWTPGGRG